MSFGRRNTAREPLPDCARVESLWPGKSSSLLLSRATGVYPPLEERNTIRRPRRVRRHCARGYLSVNSLGVGRNTHPDRITQQNALWCHTADVTIPEKRADVLSKAESHLIHLSITAYQLLGLWNLKWTRLHSQRADGKPIFLPASTAAMHVAVLGGLKYQPALRKRFSISIAYNT